MRIVGRVGATVGRCAHHSLVHAVHHRHRLLGNRDGAERGGRNELCCALQPAPRIVAVVGVLGHASHGQRVQRLQQQGAQPTDEHRRIGVHQADRTIGREPARPGRRHDRLGLLIGLIADHA